MTRAARPTPPALHPHTRLPGGPTLLPAPNRPQDTASSWVASAYGPVYRPEAARQAVGALAPGRTRSGVRPFGRTVPRAATSLASFEALPSPPILRSSGPALFFPIVRSEIETSTSSRRA